jgi:hypothetical protein
MNKLILLLMGIMIMPLVLSFPTNTNLNIQVTDDSGNILTGTFAYRFEFSSSQDCFDIEYTNSKDVTTDSRGIFNYTLPDTNLLDWSKKLYLCTYRDGILKGISPIGAVPYSYYSDNATCWQGFCSVGNFGDNSLTSGHLVPFTYGDYDIGGGGVRWRDLYLQGTAYISQYTIGPGGFDSAIGWFDFMDDYIIASNFLSEVANGTQPYATTSTTMNKNLNAELWNGSKFEDYLNQPVRSDSLVSFSELNVANGFSQASLAFSGVSNSFSYDNGAEVVRTAYLADGGSISAGYFVDGVNEVILSNGTYAIQVNGKSTFNNDINLTSGSYYGDGSKLTGIIGGNSSWNETYAGTKYLGLGENSTLARIGNCPSGQVVMNTTTSGVQCIAMSSGSSSGNPFDQSLNTTDNVIFNRATFTGGIYDNSETPILSINPDGRRLYYSDGTTALNWQSTGTADFGSGNIYTNGNITGAGIQGNSFNTIPGGAITGGPIQGDSLTIVSGGTISTGGAIQGGTITGTTLTDSTLSINLGSITGGVASTFSGKGTFGSLQVNGNANMTSNLTVAMNTNFGSIIKGAGTGAEFFNNVSAVGDNPKLAISGFAGSWAPANPDYRKWTATMQVDGYGRLVFADMYSVVFNKGLNMAADRQMSFANSGGFSAVSNAGQPQNTTGIFFTPAAGMRYLAITIGNYFDWGIVSPTNPTLYIFSSLYDGTNAMRSAYIRMYHNQTYGFIESGTGTTSLGDDNLIIGGNLSVKIPYGMFSSTQTQTLAVTNTAYPVTFNWTEDSYLITKSSDNANFSFGVEGDYSIILSAIASSSSPTTKRVEIWVQKNGVNVPRSNTIYDFKSVSSNTIIAVPFIIDMNTTDKFRVMWAGSDTGITLNYITNTSYSPETPSIIMTISRNSDVTP